MLIRRLLYKPQGVCLFAEHQAGKWRQNECPFFEVELFCVWLLRVTLAFNYMHLMFRFTEYFF